MKYRVYWKGEHPKPKRKFHDGEFEKRQQARQWCRNHSWRPGLTVVHPDGKEEPYVAVSSGARGDSENTAGPTVGLTNGLCVRT